MKKVKCYVLCEGATIENLEEQVGGYLEDDAGWELYGNPFCLRIPSEDDCQAVTYFYQAVIRR